MKVDEYDAYVAYISLKQHFADPSYNGAKYGFKVKASTDAYDKRRDRVFFRKVAKKAQVRDTLIRNIGISIFNGNTYIRDIAEDDALHTAFQRRLESSTYHFREEIDALVEKYGKIASAIKPDASRMSPLYREVSGGFLSSTSLIILDKLTGCLDQAHKYTVGPNPIWEEFHHSHTKLGATVKINLDGAKKILLDRLD